MSDPYIGQILQVAFNFAPVNWAQAAGQTLSINQNVALFSLIGTTFGGNGQSTFGLPQLQSRVIVGVGQTPGLSVYNWGQVGGVEQATLNQSQMPVHTHAATYTPPTGGLQASIIGGASGTPGSPNTYVAAVAGSTTVKIYGPTPPTGSAVNLSGATFTGGGVTIGQAGGNVPFPVLQPYCALWTLIALSGLFPTRS